MDIPKMSDLVNYTSKKLTGADWNTNFQKIVNWLTNGDTEINVGNIKIAEGGQIENAGSMTIGQNLTVGGNIEINGNVKGYHFEGDGSGLIYVQPSQLFKFNKICICYYFFTIFNWLQFVTIWLAFSLLQQSILHSKIKKIIRSYFNDFCIVSLFKTLDIF